MAIAPAGSTGSDFTSEQQQILSKVLWRVVPFLLLCYIVPYLDRVNVGVAGLTMNRDLGISPAEFGWSAGLFFRGYFLAETKQSCRAGAGCAQVDRAHPRHLGPELGGDCVCRWSGKLRRHAISAESRRSRFHARIAVAAFLTLTAILIRVVAVSLQRQVGTADGRTIPTTTLSKGI